MSDVWSADERRMVALRERTLRLYSVVAGLMLAGILGLIAYSLHLGPLVGPGVQASFGFALALMLLQSAVLVHIMDRVYREYPFGRRLRPGAPPPIGDAEIATFLRVVVLIAGAGAIAYVLGSLIVT